jgi:trigger factor
MAPEIKDTFSAKDKVTHYKVRIDEETLASRLKNIRRSYGKMSNPDVVTEEDVIYGELTQLSPDGTVFEGGIVNTASIRLDLIDDAKIKKSLVGLKKDDQTVFDIQKAYKNDAHQIARLLNVEEDMAKDLKSNFQLKVKNINRMEEADMNQEFFDKIYGPGAVDSEAAFIEKMKEELIGIMQENADRKLQTDLVAYGVDKFKISLPDEFLKRWLKLSNENKLSDQQIAEQYDDFAKNLKWTLMENRIMKDNAIEIQSQEVVDLAKKRIDAQFKMYSPQPLTEEQLEQYAMNFLQNREQSSRLLDEVRNQKVFEHLKTVITLDSKEIDYNKFLELR